MMKKTMTIVFLVQLQLNYQSHHLYHLAVTASPCCQYWVPVQWPGSRVLCCPPPTTQTSAIKHHFQMLCLHFQDEADLYRLYNGTPTLDPTYINYSTTRHRPYIVDIEEGSWIGKIISDIKIKNCNIVLIKLVSQRIIVSTQQG